MTQLTNTSMVESPLKAVAYARFSSDMQRGESIDAQLRAIRKYAKENNIIVIGKYIDIAKSGKNDDRPQFQKMIRDSQNGGHDLIIVHKLDRFARNRYDSVRYRHELDKNNVKLLSVLENYDSDTPEGVLIESLYEGMNEYYIRNLSREIMKGLKENAYQAKFTGGIPPLGFVVNSDLNYVINESEAQIIRKIFDMATNGSGYGEIMSRLNELGYKTKRGKTFGKNSLHSILRNPKYCGIYEFNVAPKRDVSGSRNNHGRKSENEIIRVDDAIPAIISKEQFDKVQNILNSRQHRPGAYSAKEVYLLSGKIFCGNCGSAYTGHRKFNSQKKKYVVYSCGKNQRKKECSARYIRREYIESFVLDNIAEYVFDESNIPKVCKLYKEYLMETNYDFLVQKENLVNSLKSINKKIDNLVTLMAETASKALVDRLNSFELEKAEMESRLKSIDIDNSIKSVTEAELKEWFSLAKDLFKSGSLSTSKKLIDLFVDKVSVYDDHVKMMIKIKPDLSLPTTDEDESSSNYDGDTRSCPLDGAEGGTYSAGKLISLTTLIIEST